MNVAGGGCEWLDSSGVLEDMPSLHFTVPEGVVMGMNDENQLVWQQKVVYRMWLITGIIYLFIYFFFFVIPVFLRIYNCSLIVTIRGYLKKL